MRAARSILSDGGFERDRVMTSAERDAAKRRQAAGGRASEHLSRQPQVDRDVAAEAIHIENLHKKFGQLHVLKGVSLSARDGDVVAIIGG